MMNISMSEAEREHYEYELNARADYLSEAFGDEARLLHAQALDDEREYQFLEARKAGFFSLEGDAAHGREVKSRARARASIHAPVDNVPF
jgi:hypothetical protein